MSHEDAAVLLRFPEPAGPAGRVEPVRPEADDLHHAADRALLDELPGIHGRLDVQPLGIIDGENAARLGRPCGARRRAARAT